MDYVNTLNVKKLIGGVCPFGHKHLSHAIEFALKAFDRGANLTSVWPPDALSEVVKKEKNVKHILKLANGVHSPSWTSDHRFDGQTGFSSSLLRTAKQMGGSLYEQQEHADKQAFLRRFDSDFDIIANLRPGDEGLIGVTKKHKKSSPNAIRPCNLILSFYKEHNYDWDIILPIAYVLKGFNLKKNHFMGYIHSAQVGKTNYMYTGVTGRHWLTRMEEHLSGIRRGEPKLFYNAWRKFITQSTNVIFRSTLCVVNSSYNEIMDWEEKTVDRYELEGRSVNAIPGGFRGIRELHKLGLLKKNEYSDLTLRERALELYQKVNPRAGVPNLLLRELWEDDSFAAKIICGRPDRLSVEQVQEIRRLSMWGIPLEKIAEKVKACNTDQVRRVLKGKTYCRIH